MSEEKRVEEEVVVEEVETVETPEASKASEETDPKKGEMGSKKEEAKKASSATFKDALKQVENFGQALSDALQARGNVVMVRVNDEALEHLDMLVEAEVTKSRSESAAFLIAEGIKANADLFGRIGSITSKIAELREQLRKEVNLEPEA